MKKYILDTDPGIDDIEALLFLLSREDVEIVAITTVVGNGSIDTTFTNMLKVLDFIGERKIPVYRGAELAIDATKVETDNFFGNDAMGDANLPNPKLVGQSEMSAAEAIVHYSRKYKGEINLVAIGPLTNVAIASMYDPMLPSYLKSFSVMGGDRNERTKQNCCDYAEFNARCDPSALKFVFEKFSNQHNCPFYVVDWELCQRSVLPQNIFEMVEKNCDPSVNPKKKELIKILEDKTHKGVACRYLPAGFITADIFATIASYDPNTIKKKTKSRLSECHTEGPLKGHVAFCADECSQALLIDELDMEKVVKYFISIITK